MPNPEQLGGEMPEEQKFDNLHDELAEKEGRLAELKENQNGENKEEIEALELEIEIITKRIEEGDF